MNNKSNRIKMMVLLAMLSAVAFLSVVVTQFVIFPAAPFLTYEPKSVIISIGGFLFGPLSALVMSVVVSVVEMFTVSKTGWIGLIMNVLATAAFCCPAAWIYKKKQTIIGAGVGLGAGLILSTAVMLLWNILITPFYSGLSRAEVAGMLMPILLPFNLLKGSLNALVTMLLYKPLVAALRKARLIPPSRSGGKGRFLWGVAVVCLVLLASLILLILMLKGIL